MKSKKPKLMENGHSDEMQTPQIAIKCLVPYLNKDWTIWESAWGGGSLANHLKKEGFNVIGSNEVDFLDNFNNDFDCIVTNPPYSKKEEFLRRAYLIGKPFAFLLPLTALEGKRRGELYRQFGIQLIIPNKRINFVTPSGMGGGSWFQVAWFCYKLNLPKDLNFVEL
jgi:hypothetical protein